MHFQCAGTYMHSSSDINSEYPNALLAVYKEAIQALKWQSLGKKKHYATPSAAARLHVS